MFSPEEESYLAFPDIEPVKTFLANALNLRLSGDKTQYELIVNQLRVRDDPDTLWKVLVALCTFTYQLTKQPEEFRGLLNCIFGYDWKCDIKVTVAIINLINHLVSTNSTFLGRAFQLYIKSLLPSMTTTLSTEASEESTVQYKDLIHRAIRGILIQVPTGRSVLYPILCEFFPHKRFSRNVQTEYTAQLLQICRYEPMLQARILELIVSKCLEMDVEIVIEDSGDVRIDQQALDDGDLDFDDAFEDMAHSFNSSRGHSRSNSRSNMGMGSAGKRKQLTETSAARIPAEVSEMADKLDSVLLLVVQFCEQQITGAGSAGGAGAVQEGASSAVPSSGTRDRLLQQLLGIFENNIMSIHKSKFVQFVIFFAASLHNPFAQAVAEKLVGITLDERASATQRQSAVMYLASYLSRATFLSAEFISEVLSRLLRWAASYATRTSGFALSPATSSPAFPSVPSNTSVSALSGQTSREASLDSSGLSTGSGGGKAGIKRNSSSVDENLHLTGNKSSGKLASMGVDPGNSGETIEFDEFGRAFVREVTVSRHELFYSVVQAASYTLCFYGVSMACRLRDDEAVRRCWEVIVCCKYDPLRYCLKSVRVEFIRLAAAVGLFSAPCWDAIPVDLLYSEVLQQQQQLHEQIVKNARASDSVTMTTFTTNEASSYQSAHVVQTTRVTTVVQSQGIVVGSGAHKEVISANTLDSFFPFDPCLLCKLHHSIQKAYRVWDGVPGLDDVLDEDEEYDVSDDDLEEDSRESGIASMTRDKDRATSRAIPMRKSSGKERSAHASHTPGSATSGGSMMDAFTTSSLSSVVSSIACTDYAMSIASSAQFTSHSPFAGSYFGSAQVHMAADEDETPAGHRGRTALQQEDEDSDADDTGMHDTHMAAPAATAGGSGSSFATQEKFDGNFRRPRFYSIGSTGSW